MSFKLIAISPANNNSSYQLPTRYPKFEKVGATPPLQKLKITLVLVNDLKTYWFESKKKHILLISKKTLYNILNTFLCKIMNTIEIHISELRAAI